MSKWPIGVFTSIDAGLGVKLEVAYELGVHTIQLHAPAQATRTPEDADRFLATLSELGITLTRVRVRSARSARTPPAAARAPSRNSP